MKVIKTVTKYELYDIASVFVLMHKLQLGEIEMWNFTPQHDRDLMLAVYQSKWFRKYIHKHHPALQ